MNTPTLFSKQSLLQKRIPTLLGLGVLVIALIGGTFLLTSGPTMFTPRASAEKTPKGIKVTNVSESSFTVSFYTDGKATGFVKHGSSADDLGSTTTDDRDQLQGDSGQYNLHYISVRGLEPDTTYYYSLGTDGGDFDNGGKPFEIKTAAKSGAPAAAKVLQGTLTTSSGAPADGGIIYASISGAGELSAIVRSNGSWFIPLSNARTADGSSYVTVDDSTQISITAINPQATNIKSPTQVTTTLKEADPTLAVVLDSSTTASTQTTTTTTEPTATTAASKDDQGTLTPPFNPNVDISSDSGRVSTGSGTTISGTGSSTSTSTDTPVTSESTAPTTDSTRTGTTSTDSTGSKSGTGNTLPMTGSGSTITTSSDTTSGSGSETSSGGSGSTTDTTTTSGDSTSKSTSGSSGSGSTGGSSNTTSGSGSSSSSGSSANNTGSSSNSSGSTTNSGSTGSSSSGSGSTTTGSSAGSSSTSGTGGRLAAASPTATPFSSGNPYSTPTPSPTASASASPSARVSQPSTASGIPVSGSVGTTLSLVFGGLFFLISGGWSLWMARQIEGEGLDSGM